VAGIYSAFSGEGTAPQWVIELISGQWGARTHNPIPPYQSYITIYKNVAINIHGTARILFGSISRIYFAANMIISMLFYGSIWSEYYLIRIPRSLLRGAPPQFDFKNFRIQPAPRPLPWPHLLLTHDQSL
jgi:hypothetical protein